MERDRDREIETEREKSKVQMAKWEKVTSKIKFQAVSDINNINFI